MSKSKNERKQKKQPEKPKNGLKNWRLDLRRWASLDSWGPHCLVILMIICWMVHSTESSPTTNPSSPVLLPSQQILFKQVGYYAGQTHLIHYRIPIPLQPIIDNILEFQTNLTFHHDVADTYAFHMVGKTNISLLNITDNHLQVKNVLTNAHNRLEVVKYDLIQLIQTLPAAKTASTATSPKDPKPFTLQPQSRNKRFVEFVALGTATAALTLATFNKIQLDNLQAAFTEEAHKVDIVVDVQAIHDKHLHMLQAEVDQQTQSLALVEYGLNALILQNALNTRIDSYTRKITILNNFITAAMDHKLSPGILPAETLYAILNHTSANAKSRNLRNFLNQPSDLCQLPTSFAFNSTSNEFILYLHVPLVTPDNLMSLYHYIPAPFMLSPTANYTLTPEIDHNDHLAYHDDGTFKVLSTATLDNCIRLGNAHFCKGRSIIQKDLDTSCLGSLFRGHALSAQNTCRFRITHKTEQVVEIAPNKFRIFPRLDKVEAKLKCKDDSSTKTFFFGDEVQLAPGCRLSLENHIIVADEEEETLVKNNIADWAWDAASMFPQHSIDNIDLAINHLREMGSHHFDASDLIHQLQNMPSSKIMEHLNTFSPFSWIISIVALIITTCLVITALKKFRRYRQASKQQRHQPENNKPIIRQNNEMFNPLLNHQDYNPSVPIADGNLTMSQARNPPSCPSYTPHQ
jgi:hypothetical protein